MQSTPECHGVVTSVGYLVPKQQEDTVMIWFPHEKYTSEYIAAELFEMGARVHQGTLCMVIVAAGAVGVMAVAQATCIYGM
jgi:hypothetical protein